MRLVHVLGLRLELGLIKGLGTNSISISLPHAFRAEHLLPPDSSRTRHSLILSTSQISNNGVHSLALRGQLLVIGSGDGRLKKLIGSDTKFQLEKEILLDGVIQQASLSPDLKEIIVSSSVSKLFRVLTLQLDAFLHTEGSQGPILGLGYHKSIPEILAIIDNQGFIKVFDTKDFRVITRCTSGTMSRQEVAH